MSIAQDEPIRISIAAPTPMMRAGLRAMLAGEGLEVVSEAASMAELDPAPGGVDVLVVAGISLLEPEARRVVGEGGLSLVVLSEDERPAGLLRSLPLRGWGLASPDAPSQELRAAVTAAAQGMIVVPVSLGRQLLGRTPVPASIEGDLSEEPLTARELEVLQLVSQGLSNKLIARRLQISEHTVKFHISSLYTKLGASSRTDAVNRGARLGLISF